jgi:hypothetical protein
VLEGKATSPASDVWSYGVVLWELSEWRRQPAAPLVVLSEAPGVTCWACGAASWLLHASIVRPPLPTGLAGSRVRLVPACCGSVNVDFYL